VVTVSHKLVLLLVFPILHETFHLARTTSLGICFGIPGFFGFLVWELKENWKLFEANRSPAVPVVAVGHHGETMLRFLKPGFHSGKIPKLFAKIRRAERAGYRSGDWTRAHTLHEALHHVEESIRQFVQRDFVDLLLSSQSWGDLSLTVKRIALGTNRIQIEMICPDAANSPMKVILEGEEGLLAARLVEPEWSEGLTRERAEALTVALAGFLKMCGVERLYLPDGREVFWKGVPLTWNQWLATWERDHEGKNVGEILPGTISPLFPGMN
jgi:hypothetical protein